MQPLTLAEPPTTFGPSGPAMPATGASAKSAVVVSRALRVRGDMPSPSIATREDEEVSPVVARSFDRLRDRGLAPRVAEEVDRRHPGQDVREEDVEDGADGER